MIGSVGAADRNTGGDIWEDFFVSFALFSIELFLFLVLISCISLTAALIPSFGTVSFVPLQTLVASPRL